jgi:hypothetical protein
MQNQLTQGHCRQFATFIHVYKVISQKDRQRGLLDTLNDLNKMFASGFMFSIILRTD